MIKSEEVHLFVKDHTHPSKDHIFGQQHACDDADPGGW